MGKDTVSRVIYVDVADKATAGGTKSVTRDNEVQVRKKGVLDPLVDPAGYGVIRESRMRFEERPDGLFVVTVGTPIPIENRLDTTGSMRDNVEKALKAFPDLYEACCQVLPGCDLQSAIGIFGDRCDKFILCRPQFEMTAQKIVHQLSLMFPEGEGYDDDEDPDFGLFGAAYLTKTYIERIGLKGYDFTISDACGRGRIDRSNLIRVFGSSVFDKVYENGHNVNKYNLPTTGEIVVDLKKRAHAFFLQVGNYGYVTEFWTEIFGRDHVVIMPDSKFIPLIEATIIGLTEGTIGLSDAENFLIGRGASHRDARLIVASVAHIPVGAQAVLPNYSRRPKAGDIFKAKSDLWPLTKEELEEVFKNKEATDPKNNPKELEWL